MRKFKVFVASILSYLMLISLVPSGLVETVVKAAENDYVKFVKEGYYLRSNAQYNNKTLVTYIDNNGSSNELYVALVQNGKETILKTEKNCTLAFIKSNNSSKVVIEYHPVNGNAYYEEFDFETLKFTSITKADYEAFIQNNNMYPVGYSKSLVQSFSSDRDEVIEAALSKINQYNEGYNLTISDKKFLYDSYGMVYGNDNGEMLEVSAYKINVRNSELKVSNNAITLNIKNYAKGETKNYRAVVTNNNAYIEEVEEGADFFDMRHYDGYYSLFLTRRLDDETNRLIEITNGDIVTNQVDDFGYRAFEKVGNKLYIQDYFNKTLKTYAKQGNEYKLSSEIECLASNLSYSKSHKLPTLIEKENGKVYVSQIVGDNIVKRVDVTNEIEKFNGSYGYNVGIEGDSNGNYVLDSMNTFVVIQKASSSEEVPDVPNVPETPETPEVDNSVTTEVPTIKPNDKNEIVVSTEEEVKKVEVVVNDIEAIKEGTGSLNIAINNDVQMNLPLSIIDKTLLDGAKNVVVQLNVEEDSEITKDLKAVNKVFDFNLLVNKEDGSVEIHNFKDGVAEITFTLTDEDLKGLDKDNLVVYYYNEETKKFEAMETKIEGNKVTFKTNHFSKYIISEKITDETIIEPGTDKEETTTEAGKGTLPDTGSVVSNNVVLVLALGTVLVGSAMFSRKKEVA